MCKVAGEQSSRDNLNWPFSSAKDKAEDAAANLPPPKLLGEECEGKCGPSEWVLSVHDVECLAIGAGILGSGGGGDPKIGRLRAIRMLEDGKEVKILNPCRHVLFSVVFIPYTECM